jgi:hypothetical protein
VFCFELLSVFLDWHGWLSWYRGVGGLGEEGHTKYNSSWRILSLLMIYRSQTLVYMLYSVQDLGIREPHVQVHLRIMKRVIFHPLQTQVGQLHISNHQSPYHCLPLSPTVPQIKSI